MCSCGVMQARDAERRWAERDAGADVSSAWRLIALAERLGRTAAVARALVMGGRTVDLAGIEDGIGMLCAKTLDLPPHEARVALPALHALLAELASLTAALRPPDEA